MSDDILNPGVEEKIAVAKQKKDEADQAFKAADFQTALRAYHEATFYLSGIYKNAMSTAMPANGGEPQTDADIMLDKIYSNMSMCHIKRQNWKRAVETADKALSKNSLNTKALFRKGKALGELGHFEKAEKILNDLLTKEVPESEKTAIKAELVRLKAMDKEREKEHNKKFKGFLNRGEKEKGENDEEEK
ncbi:hypothetical protein EIP91_003445 [Steccherinum ochraceum]|uniref:Uncharacterized protein n=1 Tax=Steccherinum ochraceum TaxID=92696 RepID=A0A4R0RIX9_9APHY|nr:hypothetical protein EIP91_003445 [Steccherinum ochraceum]